LPAGILENIVMFAYPVLIVAVLASPEIQAALKRDPYLNARIVVFRHHPGLIDTKERMAARERDAEAILGVAKNQLSGFEYSGGLGRGYELCVHARELGRWKGAIDRLMKAGALRYYTEWALDRNGYGLVPAR
jgi:hypothetical protein